MNIVIIKKIGTHFIYLIGWSILLFLWSRFLLDPTGIHSTYKAMKVIALWVIVLFVFFFIWNRIKSANLMFHRNSNLIRIKAKGWNWTEITFDANDNIINEKKRYLIICNKLSDKQLTALKKHSYSAILIRDGYIKEAIGFLRQVLQDPSIGQLERKITENELNTMFTEGNLINNIKECCVTVDINRIEEKKFQISVLGYNKQQVDELLNELMVYCRNLEEENKELKNDLLNYNKKTQLNHITDISNAKWEEKEYSLLLGLALQEDIYDYKGNLICNKNTVITSQLIDNLISKGLYGELVAAADPRKGVNRNVR